MCCKTLSDPNSEASPALFVVYSKSIEDAKRHSDCEWYRVGTTAQTLANRLVAINIKQNQPKVFTHLRQPWHLLWAVDLSQFVNIPRESVERLAKEIITLKLENQKILIGANNYYQNCGVPENERVSDDVCFALSRSHTKFLWSALDHVLTELNNRNLNRAGVV